MSAKSADASSSEPVATNPGTSPKRAGLVLAALILSAGVANLNLAVANVALPTIGSEFNASQVQLNLIAVGYSLAWRRPCSTSVLSATEMDAAAADGRPAAVDRGVHRSRVRPERRLPLRGTRGRGASAGMAYPTTLALITRCGPALPGPSRSRCGPPSAAGSRCSGRCCRGF